MAPKVKEETDGEKQVAVQEPIAPQTVEVYGESKPTYAKIYPQVRVGVCEFHGSPYGNVDTNTLKGKCHHVCATDPLCPHSKTGCPQGKDIMGVGADGEPEVIGHEEYCRHEHDYRNVQMRCSYCPENADFRGILKKRTFYVYSNPDNPKKLIICCSDYRCVAKHQKRFSANA